jgi:hypothetical protein
LAADALDDDGEVVDVRIGGEVLYREIILVVKIDVAIGVPINGKTMF